MNKYDRDCIKQIDDIIYKYILYIHLYIIT